MPKISEILGKYLDEYDEIYEDEEETNLSKIYKAINKESQRDCCLKVISKEKLKSFDYNYLLERFKKEEEITKLCNSENTVNLYRKLETENSIIFELEDCDSNLQKYIRKNGELLNEKNFFKEIVISMAKALKTIHEKGLMHRDIKPANIYYKKVNDKNIIKLGDFGCSIYIKDNISDSIGSLLYSAPEMVKDLEYDEKIDLWSLGVTLFELYFGVLPYGPNANANAMTNAIYNEKKFIFKKTFAKGEKPKLATLDILFKRLLTINPKNRMTYDEFFEYVFSDDFMKEGVICVNNNKKYKEIYDIILAEDEVIYEEEIIKESDDPVEQNKQNAKKIQEIVKGGLLPDIMNFSNSNAENDKNVNNIIYYDANIDYINSINQDSDIFERITPGAFILCTNIESLNLIRTEILTEIKNDTRMSFNLITTGSQCQNVMTFLDTDPNFKKIIKNVCVYCMNLERWSKLKNQYELVYDVYTNQNQVIDFIKKFSSEEIKPYPLTKLITYNEYIEKYKDRHIRISQFYGDLTPETYKQNMKKMKSLIETDKNLYKPKNTLNEGFMTFEIKKDLKLLDKLIIKEYTKETFYGDLNKWLMNSKLNSYDVIAYFTARLMYSLNSFGKTGQSYYNNDKTELRRGIKLSYSSLLPYERAKGKVILLSAFTSTTESEDVARNFSGRNQTASLYNTRKKFSVILIITNQCKKNWIPNGVNIQKLSVYDEKEILYQPFSFYYVRDVQIDKKLYTADIYLETIGKLEILEEKIKIGKKIEYNKKEKIMQVK